jgi:predicted component of type VI protein secretion system
LQGLLNRVFPLVKAPHTPMGPVVVGRIEGADVDVVIPDASISKRHCAFATQRGTAAVTDSGSRNGTAVNGAPITDPEGVSLAGGETITIGRLEFTFETAAGFAELVGSLGPE